MKILINLHPYDSTPMLKLKDDFPDVDFIFESDTNKISQQISDIDALICLRISKDQLDKADKLKWIQSLTSGLEMFPIEEILSRNIILTKAAGVHRTHMTEYALSMMILGARNLNNFILNKNEKTWTKEIPQDEIYNKKLGILGLGNIGKEIAKKANFMGMTVYGIKNHISEVEYVEKVFPQNDIAWIFRNCDYIINLLPFTDKTNKIVNKDLFNIMKPSAVMINMGRGKTVDENDLYDALINNKFKLYISDVFSKEPLPTESPLWNLDNIVITPHICGPNVNYSQKLYDVIKPNVASFINCDTLSNIYSIEKKY